MILEVLEDIGECSSSTTQTLDSSRVGPSRDLVLHSQHRPSETQMSPHASSPLHHTYSHQSVQPPEETSDTKQFIHEPTQQQINEILQKIHQLQEKVDMADRESLNRQSVIQYRVQALLNTPSIGVLPPRFFIVLPKDIDLEHGQDKSSRLFRVHFLCECGSHTMTKNAKTMHEVHMTDHTGYDLKRPREFFDKYGSYVLTTMYMVKYGAVASGFIVPPLSRSKLVVRAKEDQEHVGFVKKNISRLVDDTINYLEDMTRAMDNDPEATSHWSLRPADTDELKSYLSLNPGEKFPGGLYLWTKQGSCSWICSEHLNEFPGGLFAVFLFILLIAIAVLRH